jgi:hypothetical protein
VTPTIDGHNRRHAKAGGDRRVALPDSPNGEPFSDPDDVADVVVAVLTDDGHARRMDEAIGPRSLSFAEAVEGLAVATGQRIRYFRISTETNAALVARQPVSEEVVIRLGRVLTGLLDGRDARRTSGLNRRTGREPGDAASTTVWRGAPCGLRAQERAGAHVGTASTTGRAPQGASPSSPSSRGAPFRDPSGLT